MKKRATMSVPMSMMLFLTCGNIVTNIMAASLEGKNEIEKLISCAPAMMLSQTEDVGAYKKEVCGKITKCPEPKTRYVYFRRLMDSACSVKLDAVENMIPLEKVVVPKVDDVWAGHVRRKDLEIEAHRIREMRIASVRGSALRRLAGMADDIYGCLLLEQPAPAPSVELFEPYFKLIEKLKNEAQKERWVANGCDSTIDQVEYLFNFIYLKAMEATKTNLDQRDIAAFEARFKQVVGRPIRSAEQYKADARRRTEANIRENRKQEEANRRAAEYQKQFNKEHNLNVK